MFKKLGLAVLAASFLLPVQAKAEQIGVYVAPKFVYGIIGTKGKIGWNADDEDGNSGSFGNAPGGALAVGYDFKPRFDIPVRTELEYAAFGQTKADKRHYKEDAEDEGPDTWVTENKLGIQSLFVNVYYDFHTSTAFTPYVGAGLGMGFVSHKGRMYGDEGAGEVSMVTAKKSKTNFAYNIGLGCAWAFNDYISLDLGYRYANFGKSQSKWQETPKPGKLFCGKTGRIDMHQFMLGLRIGF